MRISRHVVGIGLLLVIAGCGRGLLLASGDGAAATLRYFLYSADYGTNQISMFRVNEDKTLTALTQSPLDTGAVGPFDFVKHPNLPILYYIRATTSELAYLNIENGGSLIETGAAVGTDTVPQSVGITPDGKCIFTANNTGGSVSAFSLTESGVPAFVENEVAGSSPIDLIVHPGGNYIYVGNAGSNTISRFVVNPADCSLGPKADTATVDTPRTMVLHPDGHHLYAAGLTLADVGKHDLDGSGQLGSVATVSGDGGVGTGLGITINPAGTFVFSTYQTADNKVSTFAVSPTTGALTLKTGPSFPFGVSADPDGSVVHPLGGVLYVAGYGSSELHVLSIGTDGALSALSGTHSLGVWPKNLVIVGIP